MATTQTNDVNADGALDQEIYVSSTDRGVTGAPPVDGQFSHAITQANSNHDAHYNSLVINAPYNQSLGLVPTDARWSHVTFNVLS